MQVRIFAKCSSVRVKFGTLRVPVYRKLQKARMRVSKAARKQEAFNSVCVCARALPKYTHIHARVCVCVLWLRAQSGRR